jgi:protein involved in polysaccharide export with SLBB domain
MPSFVRSVQRVALAWLSLLALPALAQVVPAVTPLVAQTAAGGGSTSSAAMAPGTGAAVGPPGVSPATATQADDATRPGPLSGAGAPFGPGGSRMPAQRADLAPSDAGPALPEPDEFERLASIANSGRPVWRFGRLMRQAPQRTGAPEVPARVPGAYRIQTGDELSVTVWGSIEGDWRLRVDSAGRITLPRVGPVPVAGARLNELEPLLRSRLERVFRGFELAAAVARVSPMRIKITGFVERPGEFVVPGLTTISAALALADGPAPGGSYRRIRLVRAGSVEARFDLYALLDAGDRTDDRLLEPDDLLHVEAAGPQAAMLGPVNRPAVFELTPGATVGELLRLAGGMTPVADRERLVLERLGERNSVGSVELSLPRDLAMPVGDGDLLRAVSRVAAALPSQPRNKRVRVDGEVRRPGEYVLPASATLLDALQAAGGPTEAAYLFGTELRRERVRRTQEVNYERALQELEAEAGRIATGRQLDDGTSPAAAEAAARQLINRLRARRPDGRVVLELTPESTELPALELEDGDQLRLTPRGQSVGVFGSVYNSGSFVHPGRRTLGDFLQRAGGPTSGAEYEGVFVVRANGSVLSARQGGRFNGVERFEAMPALPGDTIFVPEKLQRITFVQGAKDWTQILYQFGLGVAALLAIR